MDFRERAHENLKQRKETAEKRLSLLDNIEKLTISPKKVQSPGGTRAAANTLARTPEPLHTPAEATPIVDSKNPTEPGASKCYVNPSTEEFNSRQHPSAAWKGKQKSTEGDVSLTENNDIPDGLDENKMPIKPTTNLASNHSKNLENFDDWDVTPQPYFHPEMVLIKSNPNKSSKPVATKFEIQENKVVEAPDDVGQQLWDKNMEKFTHLSESMKVTWSMKKMCCLEEKADESSLYGDETHCLVEYRDLASRYSFKFYKGIYSWYVKFLDGDWNPGSMKKFGNFPPGFFRSQTKIKHPFYRNMLVPRTHIEFATCEDFARRHWESYHKDCHHGHFRINISVNTDQIISDGKFLQSPDLKFTSHRVCGHALVVDLFRAIGGSVDGRVCREPEDWQCLREVLEYKTNETTGKLNYRVGRSYVYGDLKAQEIKTMIVDTTWFKHGDSFVWLLPTKNSPPKELGLV